MLIGEKIYCSLINSAWSFSPSQAPFRAFCSNALLVVLTLLVFPVNWWDHQSQILTARWIYLLFIRIHWSVSRSVMPDSATPWIAAHQGSSVLGTFQARILEWVAISFSRGSSRPRDWTQVSCTAGKFFTDWAMREALISKTIFRNSLCLHACKVTSALSDSLWCYGQ